VKKLGDLVQEFEVYGKIGETMYELGNCTVAIEMFLQQLEIATAVKVLCFQKGIFLH
jgi:hypothetical protein